MANPANVNELPHDLLAEKALIGCLLMDGTVFDEISNLKLHTSGHIYLTLKDDKSQIPAVFFSRYNQGLKFRLKDGLKVLVFGKVSVYEPRGSYQVYIEKIVPV